MKSMKSPVLFTKSTRFSRKAHDFHYRDYMSFRVITKYRSFDMYERPNIANSKTNPVEQQPFPEIKLNRKTCKYIEYFFVYFSFWIVLANHWKLTQDS